MYIKYNMKYVQMVGSLQINAILFALWSFVVGKGTYMSSPFGDVRLAYYLVGASVSNLGMPLVTYRICG